MRGDKKGRDFQEIYAIQHPADDSSLPEGAREEHFKVSYLDHQGEVKEATACLFLPKAEEPVPLVFVGYYKISANVFELQAYLREGWAVGCIYEDPAPKTELTRDCLVSNSALLWELRHRPEIDENRIAIVGGSAGGYMGLMLSALHLLACCTSVRGAPANIRFNYIYYAQYVSGLNSPALLNIPKEKRNDPTATAALPVPLAVVLDLFLNPEVIAWLNDPMISAAMSPLLLTRCFSNPLLEMHNTSDILVPVDQITRSFTYAHVSADLPEDYKIRLSDYELPEEISRSFVEMLPEGSWREWEHGVLAEGEVYELPFDDKPFQIEIINDGEPWSHGGHDAGRSKGRTSDVNFIRHSFAEGLRGNTLTEEKLALLVARYAGCSIQFPAHEGEIYGSLRMYRQEVVEELAAYFRAHPEENAAGRLTVCVKREPALTAAAGECLEELLRAV